MQNFSIFLDNLVVMQPDNTVDIKKRRALLSVTLLVLSCVYAIDSISPTRLLADTNEATVGSPAVQNAATISAGTSHTCAVLSTGGVKCWGKGDGGRLGNGSSVSSNTPVDVTGLSSGVAAIAAGGDHTCALLTTGAVKCWGTNTYGQLGDSSTASSSTPVDVTGLSSGVAAVTAGNTFSCALLSSGAVKCWGANGAGQLGDNTVQTRTAPVDVKDSVGTGLLNGVTAISAGLIHTCALFTNGTVQCWGRNVDSQLGINDPSVTSTKLPVNVVGLPASPVVVVAITSGNNHTCALLSSGAAVCWGNNIFGQLGTGNNTNANFPASVSGITNAKIISAGNNHTCVVLTTGAAQCWGSSGFGQMGTGNNNASNVPVQVSGLLSDVIAITAGNNHTSALLSNGDVATWGSNSDGQLGDGTTQNRNTPFAVTALTTTTTTTVAATTGDPVATTIPATAATVAATTTVPVATTIPTAAATTVPRAATMTSTTVPTNSVVRTRSTSLPQTGTPTKTPVAVAIGLVLCGFMLMMKRKRTTT